jgi:hypothetical protein
MNFHKKISIFNLLTLFNKKAFLRFVLIFFYVFLHSQIYY